MNEMELKERVLTIMNAQSKMDGRLRTAWTGDVRSIESVEEKILRVVELSAEYRKRELQRKKSPSSEPWGTEPEPKELDVWEANPEWIDLGKDDCSDWRNAGEYWEKCSECEGRGSDECVVCNGSGKRTCRTCGGAGVY